MTLETILPIPDLFQARRVLCIQPHYDDNDIAAAGTLAGYYTFRLLVFKAGVYEPIMSFRP